MGSREKLARWLKTQAADVSAALQSDAPASANAQVWCIIEQVPTWHLVLTSPSPSGVGARGHVQWQSGSRLSTRTQVPVWRGAIRGHGAHARHQPQRWQTGTCALCKLHEKNKCFKSSVNISKEKKRKKKKKYERFYSSSYLLIVSENLSEVLVKRPPVWRSGNSWIFQQIPQLRPLPNTI